MPVPSYGEIWPIYAAYWDKMKVTRLAEARAAAKRLLAAKDRYQAIEKRTGVPWYTVAVLHERESGQRWDRQLAQGDPLNRPSRHVPAGRGPFATFEDSAVDALVTLKHYDRIADWRLEKIFYYCEKYNGWGYWQYHGKMPSPYIWGGTNIQVPGKYISDGRWSSTTLDVQLGCAAMLRCIMDADSSVNPQRET